MFTGTDQADDQVVKIQRVLGQGLRQAGTRFDFGLDLENQVAHALVLVAAADNLECLHQWYAC